MDNHFIIKKLGGENAAELSKSSRNIYDDYVAGNLQAVVVSAIRSSKFNTTDHLINLGIELSRDIISVDIVQHILDKILNFHLLILSQKLSCSQEKLIEVTKKEFDFLNKNIFDYINSDTKRCIPSAKNDYSIQVGNGESFSILGFGERVSCKIFSSVIDDLSSAGICSKSVDLSHLVNFQDIQDKSEKEIFNFLSKKVSEIVDDKILGGKIPVLSGYIGVFNNGIEDTIGRGYSDATAAICTVGLAKKGYEVVLEIQKSVPGLMSADPRILENPKDAQVIEYLDYLTAREITGDCGAQAKLLHHQTLRNEVQEAGVKIHLFDPFLEKSTGSWIENKIFAKNPATIHSGIEFVGGRNNVIFFSISSGKMFENGILARLFLIVKDYFPVDIVSASETEVTFTIDGNEKCGTKLEEMKKKIRKEFQLLDNTSMEFVEYVKNKTLIFCVGQHMKDYIGLMARATKVLGENEINIEMVSQGRLQRAMIFGIDQSDMKKAINVLHKEFIG